jgi:C4-dicarboxylate-specific signal transduction histidine kinase
VADTLSLVSASFKTNNIEIDLKCDEENSVNGFPNEFSQVLLNVLSNAKDAIVEREVSSGRIEISMAHDEKNAWVVVRDNAGGIPVDVLPKIFEPYFTTKEKGSGIGLYMSNMIMEHMDGKIEARNAGEGAEFMIVLPKWAQ